jgi:hypothetical protein
MFIKVQTVHICTAQYFIALKNRDLTQPAERGAGMPYGIPCSTYILILTFMILYGMKFFTISQTLFFGGKS